MCGRCDFRPRYIIVIKVVWDRDFRALNYFAQLFRAGMVWCVKSFGWFSEIESIMICEMCIVSSVHCVITCENKSMS